MKKLIAEECRNNNISLSKINMDQDISDIVHDIEQLIINRDVLVDNPRIVMANLWKIERQMKDSILFKTESFQSKLDDILTDSRYELCGDFIVNKQFIECTVIQSRCSTVLLNDDQKQKIAELGYGISSYKIRKGNTIREVYCEGKHPNLNDVTKQFCLDVDFLDLELTKVNLLLLEELLSQFNMESCYILHSDKNKIMEAI